MAIRKWQQQHREMIADMRIFRLSRVLSRSPRTGVDREIALVETGDWVNVVALTDAGEVVLVEQYRHGTDAVTLEIPGGLVDPGESPLEAAVRELREETGYTGRPAERIGSVGPNPAFINNACHTYLIEGCRPTHDLALDDGEDIEVRVLPLREIPGLIAGGDIDHALVVCGFWWLAQARPELFRPLPEGRAPGRDQ